MRRKEGQSDVDMHADDAAVFNMSGKKLHAGAKLEGNFLSDLRRMNILNDPDNCYMVIDMSSVVGVPRPCYNLSIYYMVISSNQLN